MWPVHSVLAPEGVFALMSSLVPLLHVVQHVQTLMLAGHDVLHVYVPVLVHVHVPKGVCGPCD